jgi:hypothetical protein
MNNQHTVIGYHNLRGFKVDVITAEPCLRLSQYFMGIPIVCSCSVCKKRGQSPEEAKVHMDKAYNK